MLEICVGSLIWSINVCSSLESELKVFKAVEGNIASDKVHLAQGRPYESDYEREAEQERERRDIWNHGGSDRDAENRDRRHDDGDDYRREVERGRIYREPDGQSNREAENRDRRHDDGDDYRREVETDRNRDRYNREDRRREVDDRIYRQPDR